MATQFQARDGPISAASNSESQQKPLTPQEHAALTSAADLHTVTQIIQIWSDRLQLISVYASFFTSIDSLLFSLAANQRRDTNTAMLTSASLVGALIFHAATAILAYVSSFILIRYRLNDAESHSGVSTPAPIPRGPSQSDPEKPTTPLFTFSHPSSPVVPFFATPLSRALLSHPPDVLSMLFRPIHSRNISIRRVRIFTFGRADNVDPTANADSLIRLLTRCHSVCSLFAMAGFALVVMGVVAYAWAALDRVVSIFASACVATTLAIGLLALY